MDLIERKQPPGRFFFLIYGIICSRDFCLFVIEIINGFSLFSCIKLLNFIVALFFFFVLISIRGIDYLETVERVGVVGVIYFVPSCSFSNLIFPP